MSISYVKLRRDLDCSDQKYIFLEDYLRPASITEARKLTEKVFYENKDFVANYDYAGYKITWSWYEKIFQIYLSFLEIKPLIEKLESIHPSEIILIDIPNNYAKIIEKYFDHVHQKKQIKLFSYFKEFIHNSILMLFNIVSLIYFSFKRNPCTAIRTEDLVFQGTKSDFRLNHLYIKFAENNIQYIEFIRSRSLKVFFTNIFKRRRFGIYYTSIVYFINLFHKKSTYKDAPNNFFESILFDFHNENEVLIKSMPLMKMIFKVTNIKDFILISFNHRGAHLSFAAKSLNIKTIGIMHGLQQKEFAVYEFMEGYSEEKKIGCDVYGVWSPHYLDYFKKFSKILNRDNIFYSGLLRPVENFKTINLYQRTSLNKIKVLIISEPLISAAEIIPFLKQLLKHKDIEVAIKVRPMVRDVYYEDLKILLPQSLNLKVFNGKIEDIAHEYDVFLGSNSTAVIEASLFGKISVLLDSQKFGDYFEMDSLIPRQLLLVKNPKNLYENIVNRVNNENSLGTIHKIRHRFFGDNLDGTQWIISQIDQDKHKGL
jgi:hypothetical protein